MIEEQITATDQATTSRSRRRFSMAQKKALVRESQVPGLAAAQVAQAHAVNASQLFKWPRQYLDEPKSCAQQLVPIHFANLG